MKTEQEIIYKGIKLLVSGEYIESEERTNDYPGAPSDFRISKITLEDSDIDIWNLFGWDDLQEIGELAIQEIEK